MTILCSLKNINLNFGNKPLFHKAELIIHHGDKIGLLGLNGKGKSSLFKIINHELTPDNSIPPFLFDKSNNPENPFTTFMVPQEIPLSKNEDTSIIDFILGFYPKIQKSMKQLEQINHSLSNNNSKDIEDKLIEQQKIVLDYLEHENWWQVIQQYESYLKVFNITDFSVPVSILSGGEQKKVLLSLGLSTPAEVVLWDEPTNHLDIETIKLLENELEATNKTFLIISHDRFLLSKVTNKIFQIQNKQIMSYNGKYTEYLDYLSQQDQQRKKQLAKLNNTLSRETEWMRQGVKARGTKSKKRIEGYHNLRQEVEVLKSLAKKELKLNINESLKKNKKLIELKGASFGYESKRLINNLSLSIFRGDKIGIVGANGIGKSTLTDLISEKLSPDSGEIKYYPELIIQNFSQKREELNPDSTPFELLGEGTDTLKLSDGRSKNVIAYFKDFLFSQDEVHRPINTFSGGEKNRIQLALNLKRFGDIWIFDEPTNDLDLETLQILEDKLSAFKGSLIVISHDRYFLENVTNKIWYMDNEKFEIFNAGYSQVQHYLETFAMEKQIKLNCKETDTIKNEPSFQKATNKDKERLKVIHNEIKTLEQDIAKLECSLRDFDYTDMNNEANIKLQTLNNQQEQNETQLLQLYEELETLEELNK